jgi:DNA polymerase I
MISSLPYREIWFVDFEYGSSPGDRPVPVCMVASEARSGRIIRAWQDDFQGMTGPPFDVGPDALFVAYFASAEFGCFKALNWSMPANVLDLYVEFKNITNGLGSAHGFGLLGALSHYGIDGISSAEKTSMRDLILSGGPWSVEERGAILDYCQTDVDALARLLPKMEMQIDLPRALLRGRYMWAVAGMEWEGVPWDVEAFDIVRRHWEKIKRKLIDRVDRGFGVYDDGSFKAKLFEAYLIREGIPWPCLDSGALDLSDDVFREMSRAYPQIAPLREARSALSKLRLSSLAIGSDGRNRCLLSPFASRSGRNQPSNAKFAFGPDTWVRSFIRPEPERGLAYIDFSSQEFAIAAALSGDQNMIEAYRSGDPYLAFGHQSGMIPPDGTKATHKAERDLCKAVILGTQYGMGSQSLAHRIGRPEYEAKELLRLHRETFSRFWQWSDSVVDYASLHGKLWTVYGWKTHYTGDMNTRSARNFPMQANGAEILRLSIILAQERGVRVIAPVHDALMIEDALVTLDNTIIETENAMKEASRLVLNGFEIRTEAEVIRYPDRYRDPRGAAMWETVWEIVQELEPLDDNLLRAVTGPCYGA